MNSLDIYELRSGVIPIDSKINPSAVSQRYKQIQRNCALPRFSNWAYCEARDGYQNTNRGARIFGLEFPRLIAAINKIIPDPHRWIKLSNALIDVQIFRESRVVGVNIFISVAVSPIE